jgi:hypothetical protein
MPRRKVGLKATTKESQQRTAKYLDAKAQALFDNPKKSLKNVDDFKGYNEAEKSYIHSKYKSLEAEAMKKANKKRYGQ